MLVALTALLLAADPCEAPRLHSTTALTEAITLDKALSQAFLKAAGSCAVPGEECSNARLACTTQIANTARGQQAFDEGVWLRDMLLPYHGQQYPMGRKFPAAPLAADGSCNVEVAILNAAGQRRATQATRREGLLAEYELYTSWATQQHQQCKDKLNALTAEEAARRAAAERQAAANAALAAAAATKAVEERKAREAAEAEAKRKEQERLAALKREQEQRAAAQTEQQRREAAEAQRLKEQQESQKALAEERARREREKEYNQNLREQDAREAEDRRQREALEAQFKRDEAAREAALAEQKRREEVEDRRMKEARLAEREEAERKAKADAEAREVQERKEKELAAQRKKEKEELEEKQRREKEEAERKAAAAAEEKAVKERETLVAQQKAAKAKLLRDAEDRLTAARADETKKKSAAKQAIEQNPVVAAQLATEAAEAEKERIAAEKNFAEAQKKADEMVIDVTHERGGGSFFANFGVAGLSGGFGLAGLLGMHFGIWGTAPSHGMASGFEIRFWGRMLGQVVPDGIATHTSLDVLLSGRYYFGWFGVGLAAELRAPVIQLARGDENVQVGGGAGVSLAAAFVDNRDTRVVLGLSYLPLSARVAGVGLDPARALADFEVGYKYFSLHVLGGLFQVGNDGAAALHWQIGGYLGVRVPW